MLRRLCLVISLAIIYIVASGETGTASTVEKVDAQAYTWGPNVRGLSLSIAPESTIVHTHQYIKLQAAIKNSGPSISIRRVGWIAEYAFTVTRRDGSIVSPNAKVDRHIWSGSVPSGFDLTSDVIYQTQLYLDSLYDLTPGTYHVIAHTSVELKGQASMYAGLTSNEVTVIVLP